jgi:hypothetical protein
MKYPRPSYLAPGVRVEKRKGDVQHIEGTVPIPDYPISPIENLKLAAARKIPFWVRIPLLTFRRWSQEALFSASKAVSLK